MRFSFPLLPLPAGDPLSPVPFVLGGIGLAALILWGTSVDPAGAPPFALVLVLMGMPAVVIGGVVLALFQRIQEIGKGEEDDARQF